MSFFESIKKKAMAEIKNKALADLVKEQSLKDLLVKREFRISQAYLQREVLDRALDDELPELSIFLLDGLGEIKGKFRKRLVPFPIPFSASFSIHGVEFSSARKVVLLKLEQVGPIDIGWLTRKFIEKIDFLSYSGDLIVCDLTRVPKLTELFAYRVKGINPWDFITLKELSLRDREIVGRVGVVL